MRRTIALLVGLFLLLLTGGARAGQAITDLNTATTGCADFGVFDITNGSNGGFVPLGCINRTTHAFLAQPAIFGSQSQNFVLASPSGSAGTPAFRAIVDADVPDTITLNANGITSGTLPNARLVAVPNSALANSTITVGSDAVALGGTVPYFDPQLFSDSLSIGPSALAVMTNVGLGHNTAIGYSALSQVILSNAMVAVGSYAGGNITDGPDPNSPGRSGVFVGHVAGQYATGAGSNTFVGAFSGRGDQRDPTTGNDISGSDPLTGFDNTCMGEASCIHIRSVAQFNTGLGYNSLFGLTTGNSNTAVGLGSGNSILAGIQNTLIGFNAYRYGLGDQNTFVGTLAGGGASTNTTITAPITLGDITIPVADTSIFSTGYTVYSPNVLNVGTTVVSVNAGAGTVTLNNHVIQTTNAGGVPIFVIASPSTGGNNTAIGRNALGSISGAAQFDAAIGDGAGSADTTGSSNTFLGRGTGATLVTGSTNVLIGALVDAPSASQSNYLNIANAIYGLHVGDGTLGDNLIGIAQATPVYPLDVTGTIASRGVAARYLFERNTTLAPSAPGAALFDMRVMCGTNAGTAKLVAMAGTSATVFTVLDNIGGGFTGC